MRKQKKPVTADFSKTCAGCEYLVQEPWARGKTACRCFAPGPNRGYHMGTTCLLPYVPAWCPKRTRGAWKVSESKANENGAGAGRPGVRDLQGIGTSELAQFHGRAGRNRGHLEGVAGDGSGGRNDMPA